MRQVTIHRIPGVKEFTPGIMLVDGELSFTTLEPPWQDNKPQISCIPDGDYYCVRVDSPKFGDTFEITDVPNRSHVLFHRGNSVADTHGCVLLGMILDLDAPLPIGHSAIALGRFLERMNGQSGFDLRITSLGGSGES